MKKYTTFLPLALATFILLGYGFIDAAWTAPSSSNKATSNTAAPIDVSGTAQVKTGGLSVGALSVPGSASVQHLQVNGSLNTGVNNINMAAETTLWNAGSMHISSERTLYLLPRNGHSVYVSDDWGGAGHLVVEGNSYTNAHSVVAGNDYVSGSVVSGGAIYVQGYRFCPTTMVYIGYRGDNINWDSETKSRIVLAQC